MVEFTFCVTVQDKRSDSILFSSPALNLVAWWGIFFVRGTCSSLTSMLFKTVHDKNLYYEVLYCFCLYRLLNNPLTSGYGLLMMLLAMVVSLLNSPTQEHLLFGLSVMVITVHQLQFGHSTTEPIKQSILAFRKE